MMLNHQRTDETVGFYGYDPAGHKWLIYGGPQNEWVYGYNIQILNMLERKPDADLYRYYTGNCYNGIEAAKRDWAAGIRQIYSHHSGEWQILVAH